MSQDWIVDVLADLRRFAKDNGMGALAEQLDDTILVAAAELAQKADGTLNVVDHNAPRDGNLHRGFAEREIT